MALVFYPFTFTGVCEGELCQLPDITDFDAAGVQILAVSCDSPFAQKVWADQKGYNFGVLSDFWPQGDVARAHGVFNEAIGCANRATFLVDRNGVLVDAFATDNLGTPRERARYQQAVAKL